MDVMDCHPQGTATDGHIWTYLVVSGCWLRTMFDTTAGERKHDETPSERDATTAAKGDPLLLRSFASCQMSYNLSISMILYRSSTHTFYQLVIRRKRTSMSYGPLLINDRDNGHYWATCRLGQLQVISKQQRRFHRYVNQPGDI